ncbi:MAG TPA: hypothetical protein VHL10_08130 [Nitrososphaera sp.]|nr:hypothetical protein [Nitrososphaera sp.]
MSKATELLNAIAESLNTSDKNTCINVAMAMLVKEGGVSVESAFELLFGAGSWEQFCGNVYDALRAQAA